MKYKDVRIEHIEAMRAQQGNVCAICKKNGVSLYVDHDHATGDVRAMLCQRCNVGLGFFQDDSERLISASTYLRDTDSYPKCEMIVAPAQESTHTERGRFIQECYEYMKACVEPYALKMGLGVIYKSDTKRRQIISGTYEP